MFVRGIGDFGVESIQGGPRHLLTVRADIDLDVAVRTALALTQAVVATRNENNVVEFADTIAG